MSDREMQRREFLARLGQGATAATVGALGWGGFEAISAAAAAKSRVVVVRGTDPLKMLRSALRAFPALQAVISGKAVAIKPNMSFNNPAAWGNNTSPEVAAAVAQICADWGAKRITAIDHTMSRGAKAIKTCGVQPALEKVKGVTAGAADAKAGYVTRAVKGGKVLKMVKVPRPVAEASVLINVPVAKHHVATKVSLGLKNLMGLVWDRRYFHDAINIHEGIAELAMLFRPQLTVIDATRVMVTNGPQGPGKVQRLDTLVISTDPVAADAVAVTLTQWNRQRLGPGDVEYIVKAGKLGLGEADPAKIKIIKKRA